MAHNILARKRKENIDMEDRINDGGIKLRPSKSRNFVSAKTARNLAETSNAFKNHIAKFIDEEAKEGKTEIHYGTYGVCEVQIDTVINELANLGYKVEFNSEDQELVIMW